MAHKYLEDIGVTNTPWNWRKEDNFKWRHERHTIGFDSRECWGLDYTFYLWLYEHLMKYIEDAESVVDLTWSKAEYNGKLYSQRELIDMMLERLRHSFSEDYDDSDMNDYAYVHEIEKIWAAILPTMWW